MVGPAEPLALVASESLLFGQCLAFSRVPIPFFSEFSIPFFQKSQNYYS